MLFSEISKDTNKNKYLVNKLKDFLGEEVVHIENIESQAKDIILYNNIPFVDPTKFNFTREQDIIIRREISLLKALVDKNSPLLVDEKLVEDKYSYLSNDFYEFIKGTPLLIRKTNLATIYYLYKNALVTDDGSFKYEKIEEDIINTNTEPAPNISFGANVLLSLAKGVAGEIGGIAGAKILEKLGIAIDNGYNKLIDELKHIIYDANMYQTISEQGGKINVVINDLLNNYLPRKSTANKEDLKNDLKKYYDSLSSVMGQLSYKDSKYNYQKTGLFVYVLAVNVMLSCLQELANIDISYKETIKATSRNSANYVDKIRWELISDKSNEIDALVNQVSEVINNPIDCGRSMKSRYYFYYNRSKGERSKYYEQSGCKDSPRDRCEKAREEYIKKIESMQTDLYPHLGIITSLWLKLS